MAAKNISATYQTGASLDFTVIRNSDGYLLDDTDGVFRTPATAADKRVAFAENANVPGLYEKSEARTVWTDGTYTIIVYVQGQNNALAAQSIAVASDAELDATNLPVNVAAVKTDTAAILVDTGTDGVVLPQAQADKVWGTATRAITDKAGFSLSAAGVQAIWDALTAALTTVGSIGKKLADWVIGTTQTADVATRPTLADMTGSTLAKTADIPTAAAIADQVWDEAIAGHLGAGSTGNALNAAGSAGDPWSTPLPGAYGAGTAGKIVGDNINATVASRSTLDAAGVRTAVGLATANLDTQLGDVPTVSEFNARTSAAPVSVGDAMTLTAAYEAAKAAASPAQVNAEVVDALSTDTYAEPAAVPAATSSLKDKIAWLFTLARNKITQTSTTQAVRNDADGANIATAAVSDDATTFTRGKYGA